MFLFLHLPYFIYQFIHVGQLAWSLILVVIGTSAATIRVCRLLLKLLISFSFLPTSRSGCLLRQVCPLFLRTVHTVLQNSLLLPISVHRSLTASLAFRSKPFWLRWGSVSLQFGLTFFVSQLLTELVSLWNCSPCHYLSWRCIYLYPGSILKSDYLGFLCSNCF